MSPPADSDSAGLVIWSWEAEQGRLGGDAWPSSWESEMFGYRGGARRGKRLKENRRKLRKGREEQPQPAVLDEQYQMGT